jgi:hypothetical protein
VRSVAVKLGLNRGSEIATDTFLHIQKLWALDRFIGESVARDG